MGGKAVGQMQAAHVLVDNAHHEVNLQIGARLIGGGADEGPPLGHGRGEQAFAGFAPVQRRFGKPQQAARIQPDGIAPQRGVADGVINVVLQVLPDALQRMQHRQAVGAQLCLWADAREQQKLRRAECPGRDDDFAACLQVQPLATAFDDQAGGAFAIKHDLFGSAVGQHRQVRAAKHRMQIGRRRRTAFALARALVTAPGCVLADEPTGNLDPETSDQVFSALMALVRETGLAALIATHNLELAARMDRVVRLDQGRVSEIKANAPKPAQV